MTQMLASVANKHEALLAIQAGVDIIDLKNPAEGALGALPLPAIQEIIAAIQKRAVISATIGDLPMEPCLLAEAVERLADTGVDIVKIGFFAGGDPVGCIEACSPFAAGGQRMVAVLFADERPDFGLLQQLENAGFYGVMLDTANKDDGNLMEHFSGEELRQFIDLAGKHNLKAGLAGSLGLKQLSAALNVNPDYIGFRGALCINSDAMRRWMQGKFLR